MLEGSLADSQRKSILRDFENDPNFKVFLVSIKVGGVGLNLTQANVVIISEPWWNPAIED